MIERNKNMKNYDSIDGELANKIVEEEEKQKKKKIIIKPAYTP